MDKCNVLIWEQPDICYESLRNIKIEECHNSVQSYLKAINTILLPKLIKDEQFSNISHISKSLASHISFDKNNLLSFLVDQYKCTNYLHFFLSHIKAIKHYLNTTFGNSFNTLNIKDEFEKIIDQGEKMLLAFELYMPLDKTYTPRKELDEERGSIIQGKEDDLQLELWRKHEQERLDKREDPKTGDLLFKKFLLNVWRYAIADEQKRGRPSKKIFISYGWPIGDEHHEAWTKNFIQTLVNHLMYGGLQVYLDESHSGAGFDLGGFMQLIQTVDHVLVISSRTMGYKLTIPESGAVYEYKQIKKHLDKHPKLSDPLSTKRFIIPVLLNSKQYYHEDFRGKAEVSFYKESYLNAIKQLFKFIYEFDKSTFDNWWEKKLNEHHIYNNLWNVPSQNLKFTERKDIFDSINKFFVNSNKALALTACHGLGGVGKTQIAIEYVYRYGYLYNKVYWLDVSSEKNLQNSLINLGIREGILETDNIELMSNEKAEEEIAGSKNVQVIREIMSHLVKDWLENYKVENWLLVLDNAPNYKEIKKLLPVKGGKILITSRHTQWPGNTVTVDVFTPKEAQDYARAILGDKKVDDELVNLNILIEKLGRLPLGLAQAFAYIATNGPTIAEYITRYDEERELILAKDLLPPGDEHEPVAVTFNITLQKMYDELPESAEFLNYLIYFDNQDVPVEIIKYLYSDRNFSKTKLNDLADNIRRIAVQYSMLSFNENKRTISIHPLLHQVMQIHFKKGDRVQNNSYKRAVEAFIIMFENSINEKSSKLHLCKHNYYMWNEYLGSVFKFMKDNNSEDLLYIHEQLEFYIDIITLQNKLNVYLLTCSFEYIKDENLENNIIKLENKLQEYLVKIHGDIPIFNGKNHINLIQLLQSALKQNDYYLPEIYRHLIIISEEPLTKMPVYEHRFYCQDQEVASAKLYGVNLLCSSADKTRNNVLEATGQLKELENYMSEDTCAILPPNCLDLALSGAKSGVLIGTMRGLSNTTEKYFLNNNYGQAKAKILSQALFYTSYFSLRTYEIESINPEQSYYNTFYQAGYDALMMLSIHAGSSALNYVGDKVKHAGWNNLGAAVSNASQVISYGNYAYQSIRTYFFSPIPTYTASIIAINLLSSISAGKITQHVIENTNTIKNQIISFFKPARPLISKQASQDTVSKRSTECKKN